MNPDVRPTSSSQDRSQAEVPGSRPKTLPRVASRNNETVTKQPDRRRHKMSTQPNGQIRRWLRKSASSQDIQPPGLKNQVKSPSRQPQPMSQQADMIQDRDELWDSNPRAGLKNLRRDRADRWLDVTQDRRNNLA